jgi:hypothetical protein
MTLKRWAATLLASAGFAIIAAAPSYAQTPVAPADPEWEELACVYTALMDVDDDAYYAVVDAYLEERSEGELFEAAASVIDTATDTCATKHGWTLDQQDVAISMAVAGTVADAIEGWFLDEGYSDEEINDIIGLVDVMSDEDVVVFLTEDWRRDDEFLASIETQLAGVGLEGDSSLMDMGMVLLETYLIGMYQSEQWMTFSDS